MQRHDHQMVIIYYSFYTSDPRVILCLEMSFHITQGSPILGPRSQQYQVIDHWELGCSSDGQVCEALFVCAKPSLPPHPLLPPSTTATAGPRSQKAGDCRYNYSDIVFTYTVYGPQNHWVLVHKLQSRK